MDVNTAAGYEPKNPGMKEKFIEAMNEASILIGQEQAAFRASMTRGDLMCILRSRVAPKSLLWQPVAYNEYRLKTEVHLEKAKIYHRYSRMES